MEPTTLPMPSRNYVARDPREKSVPLSILLSIMPGLGQIYVGCITQGFINVMVVGGTISVLNLNTGGLEPFLGIFLAFFWLYNMIDAGRRAQNFNQQLAGMGPDALLSQDTGSALIGGLVILLLGMISLAHVSFGLSMAWMERWWPLVLILVGGYQVWRVVLEYRRKEKNQEMTEQHEVIS